MVAGAQVSTRYLARAQTAVQWDAELAAGVSARMKPFLHGVQKCWKLFQYGEKEWVIT